MMPTFFSTLLLVAFSSNALAQSAPIDKIQCSLKIKNARGEIQAASENVLELGRSPSIPPPSARLASLTKSSGIFSLQDPNSASINVDLKYDHAVLKIGPVKLVGYQKACFRVSYCENRGSSSECNASACRNLPPYPTTDNARGWTEVPLIGSYPTFDASNLPKFSKELPGGDQIEAECRYLGSKY